MKTPNLCAILLFFLANAGNSFASISSDINSMNDDLPLADDHSIEFYVEKYKDPYTKRKTIEITTWRYENNVFTEDDIVDGIEFDVRKKTGLLALEHSSITIVSLKDKSSDKTYTYFIYDFEEEALNNWYSAKRINQDEVMFAVVEGRDHYDPKYHDFTFECEVYLNDRSLSYDSGLVGSYKENNSLVFGVEAGAFYDNRNGGFYETPLDGLDEYSFRVVLLAKIPNIDFIACKKQTIGEHEFWRYGYEIEGFRMVRGEKTPNEDWIKLQDGNTLLLANQRCRFTYILNDFLSSETPEGALVLLNKKNDACNIPNWKRTADGTIKIYYDKKIVHSGDYTLEISDGKTLVTFKKEFSAYGINENRTFILLGAEDETPAEYWYQTELVEE